MVQKSDDNISLTPKYELSPTEKEYREKYKTLLRRRDELEGIIKGNKSALDSAQKAYNTQIEIYNEKERTLDNVRCISLFVIVFVTLVILALFVLDTESVFGLLVAIIVVDLILYNIIIAIPRSSRNDEKAILHQKQEKLQKIKTIVDDATKELQEWPVTFENCKKDFRAWVKSRNELIDFFSTKKLYQYLDFPFEPLLNEKFQPVGTNTNVYEFRVFIKSSVSVSQYRGYRYHRSASCIPDSKYIKPTELLLVDAKKYGMCPCQTCCRDYFNKYDWLYTVQDKYTNAVENLKKYDIQVDLEPNQHTRVTFLPETKFDSIAPAPVPVQPVSSSSTHRSDKTIQKENNRLLTECSQLREQLNKANHRIDELRADVEKAKKSVSPVSQSEKTRLQNKIYELQSEVQRLQKSIADSESKSAKAKAEYEEEIARLKSVSPSNNVFADAMRKLENDGDKLFYNYPSIQTFYRQVTDKRFHRAMTEDIAISGKIDIQASIRSASSIYTTTLQSCNCVDYQRNHAPCKHMLFLAYHTGVLLIHKDEMEKSMKIYLDKLRTTKVPK